jgi:hypothetical protein
MTLLDCGYLFPSSCKVIRGIKPFITNVFFGGFSVKSNPLHDCVHDWWRKGLSHWHCFVHNYIKVYNKGERSYINGSVANTLSHGPMISPSSFIICATDNKHQVSSSFSCINVSSQKRIILTAKQPFDYSPQLVLVFGLINRMKSTARSHGSKISTYQISQGETQQKSEMIASPLSFTGFANFKFSALK